MSHPDDAGGPVPARSVGEIVDDMRRRIHAGEWGPWEKLPSQEALSAHYGRRRVDGAVYRAEQQLHDDGLIIVRQGTEAVVIHGREVLQVEVAGRRWRRDERVSEHVLAFDGRGQRRRYTEQVTTVPVRLASYAGMEPGAAVVERVVWVILDRRPLIASISYLPPELASAEDGSAWHATEVGQLAVVGHLAPPTRYRARTELPGPEERARLDLAPRTPMLVVSSRYEVGDPAVHAAVVVLADGVRVDLAFPPPCH